MGRKLKDVLDVTNRSGKNVEYVSEKRKNRKYQGVITNDIGKRVEIYVLSANQVPVTPFRAWIKEQQIQILDEN